MIDTIYEFLTELFQPAIIKVVGIIFVLHLVRQSFYDNIDSAYFNQEIGTICGTTITIKFILRIFLYLFSYYFYKNLLA
jgi:sterol desaturase/sphingolipid hydroxylase (fatty acid hydroxylase superfamily)